MMKKLRLGGISVVKSRRHLMWSLIPMHLLLLLRHLLSHQLQNPLPQALQSRHSPPLLQDLQLIHLPPLPQALQSRHSPPLPQALQSMYPTQTPPTPFPTETPPTPFPTETPPTSFPTQGTCKLKGEPCTKASDCCKNKCNTKKQICKK